MSQKDYLEPTDIAIINDKGKVQYYLHWVYKVGFIKFDKGIYEEHILSE